jgi:hypothetical protein
MTSSLREYGLIALLIAVSVGGYLLFERNKEDLLSFSLDAIGTKLVNLVDDETAKIRIAEAFKRFQQQVRDNELRPDQIEYVAASVLNLTKSNARISPEEAEMVLAANLVDQPTALPAPQAADREARETFTLSDADQVQLGKRIESILLFAEAVQKSDSANLHLVHFESDDKGIRIALDTEFGNQWASKSFEKVRQNLDESRLVRWEPRLEDRQKAEIRRHESHQEALEALKTRQANSTFRVADEERLDLLSVRSKLRSMGVLAMPDSADFNKEIWVIIESALAEVEAAFEEEGVTISLESDSTRSVN